MPAPIPVVTERGNSLLVTSARRVWLILYLVVVVWSQKTVVWEVAEREDSQIAAEIVSRTCLRARISRGVPSR